MNNNFKILIVIFLYSFNFAFASNVNNSKCLSAILSELPNFYGKRIDRATIKKIIRQELQTTDLQVHADTIRTINRVEHKIESEWAKGIYDVKYPNRESLSSFGEKHPLDIFRYPSDSFFKLTTSEQEIWFKKYPGLRKVYHEVGGDLFTGIQEKQRVLTESLEARIRTNPEKVNEIIKSIHDQKNKTKIDDELIDSILGIRFNEVEQTVSPTKYQGQEVWHSPNRGGFLTRYEYIGDMYRNMQLSKSDVVYDLGAGYGRVLFYGSHVNPEVTFKGVELVTERAREIQHVIDNQRLRNVSIINKNVLDVDISDGTVFYLFNPFPPIMDQVVDKLRAIGIQKKIRIASLGASTPFFDRCPWLKKIDDHSRVVIYESIPSH